MAETIFQSPIGLDPDSSAWTLTGAPTKPEAVDEPNGAPDDDTSYLECTTSPSGIEQIGFSFPPIPEAVSIVQVTLHFRSREISGVANHQPYAEVGGAEFDGAGVSLGAAYTDQSETWTTDPSTGLPWSKAAVDAMALGIKQAAATAVARLTQIIREVELVPFAAQIGAALEVASRELRLFRRPVPIVELKGPLLWGDAELMTDIVVTHFAFPSAGGAGAGARPWELALLRVIESTIDLDNLTVTVRALDLRHYLVRVWDTFRSEEAPTAAAPGAARLDPGVLWSFVRASMAWIENPAVAAQGSVQIVAIGVDVQKRETLGLLVEEERTNDLLNSAFTATLGTSWTVTGNVVADTGDLLFEASVTPRSAHFARAGSANCRLAQSPAAYAGSEILTLSARHKDDDATALTWTLQRSTDSFYWNDTTEAWGGAATQNAFAVRATPRMDQSNPIVLSAAAQTLTLTFYAEGIADQNNHLYESQLEEGRFATSAIVTEGSVVTRAEDRLQVENLGPDGERGWPVEKGTGGITWTPLASTDASLPDCVLIDVTFEGDGFDWDRLLYRHSSGEFVFQRHTDGGTFEATLAIEVTRGVAYRAVARWAGPEQEYGMAENTVSVFAGQVGGAILKGADDVADQGAPPGQWIRIGWKQDATDPEDFANGNLEDFSVSPFVLRDEEMQDWR